MSTGLTRSSRLAPTRLGNSSKRESFEITYGSLLLLWSKTLLRNNDRIGVTERYEDFGRYRGKNERREGRKGRKKEWDYDIIGVIERYEDFGLVEG